VRDTEFAEVSGDGRGIVEGKPLVKLQPVCSSRNPSSHRSNPGATESAPAEMQKGQ